MSEDMNGDTYTIRAVVETSKELEKRIMNYAKEEGVRMPRARRQVTEKGLAVIEEMKEKKEGNTEDVQNL